MENLCNLFVELSNEDRLRILHQLNKEGKKVSHLSRELGLAIQESSRHLSRLSEEGLTRKDPDGLYHITPYGRMILKEISALRFTTEHRDYFATHSSEHLPLEFVCRIGELAESKYVKEVAFVFTLLEKMFQGAEGYMWSMVDQYFMDELRWETESYKRGVKGRTIEVRDWVVPAEMLKEVLRIGRSILESLIRARINGVLEERMVDRLDIYLQVSEKEAIVAFPLMDGTFDHLGFIARDRRSHKWCEDLFRYYWERSPTRASVAEEMYGWLKKRPKAIQAFKKIAAGEEIVEGEELISELEKVSLVSQGQLTFIGELISRGLCIYCCTPSRGDAFCRNCGRKTPEI